MCLYPKLILNPKYRGNKKNGGNPPPVKDKRTLYVPIGCGKCMECKKQKSREWSIRLQEEIRTDNKGKFITLSFSDEELIKLDREIQENARTQLQKLNEEHGTNKKYIEITGYELENEIATLAVRRYLERWRYRNGKSVKHWLVTELGHTKTERIHIHGIIFSDDIKSIIEEWKYGRVWIGSYVNERTVNYIVKYINKTDQDHKGYNPKILTSAGIGKNYFNRHDSKINRYNGENTKEYYTTRQGIKLNLPKYYKNKIYSDQEKEQLWINLLNKEIRYVNKMKVDISKGEEDYNEVIKHARMINTNMGYGGNKTTKEQLQYEQQRRNIHRWTRIKKANEPPLRSNDMGGRKVKELENKRLAKHKIKVLTEKGHNNEKIK